MDVLEHLLRAPATLDAVNDLNAWFERLARCPFDQPIDRALWAGFEADRLGYAFVGGYRAALVRLVTWAAGSLGGRAEQAHVSPDLDTRLDGGAERAGRAGVVPSVDARLSLAATEAGGAHPRAIMTKLVDEGGTLLVRGEKTFATLASSAEELLVVASRGEGADGKNRLVLVRVRADAPGVTIEDRAPTPFAPEIPHARVKLVDVVVGKGDVLPGDGYDVYLKPFRTIEDTHVLAATLGNVVRTARANGFDGAVAERAVALALALRGLAARNPSDAVTHVCLSGIFSATRSLLLEHDGEWTKAAPATRDRWRRDQALLMVAESARQQRTATAWKMLA
jgi:hypothetical protein